MKHALDVRLSTAALQKLKKNRKWFMALGVSLVVFGTLATLFAYTSTVFTMVYLGAIFLLAGVAEIIKAFKVRASVGMLFVQVFFGALYALAGVFIIANPIVNAVTLTLFFALLFIILGIGRICFAFFTNAPHRTWLFLNGCLTTILGALIWQEWPESGLWVIGLFVGINVLFTGFSWIMLASDLKRSK